MVFGSQEEDPGEALRDSDVVSPIGSYSNTLSFTVLRNLEHHTSALGRAYERLSSGQRINTAGDDTAGHAVAMRLSFDAQVLTQAVRNLNDGLSAINIAESAMGELEAVIGRIEELTVQASNGSFTATQRAAIQKEVSVLQSEWNRIVDTTSFNGKKLLTGDGTRLHSREDLVQTAF